MQRPGSTPAGDALESVRYEGFVDLTDFDGKECRRVPKDNLYAYRAIIEAQRT